MQLRLTKESVLAIKLPDDKPQVVVRDTEVEGFGVVVGRKVRTFYAEARVGGVKRRTSIGILGRVREEDGHPWTVQLARQAAKEALGSMAAGVDPHAEVRSTRSGITLRQGMELHAADMRKRGCSDRSTGTLEYELPKYLPDLIDQPVVAITALALHDLHAKLSAEGKRHLANRVVAEVSAVWNTVDRIHELEGRNPASRVRRNKLEPSRARVDDVDLPAWWTKVQTLAPVRRDLRIVIAYTGLRAADACSIRWDDVDLDEATLHRPSPKGGRDKAFTLPLPRVLVDLLRARRVDNAKLFDAHGGDAGYVFPSLSRAAPYVVQPVSDPKEYRRAGKSRTAPKVQLLEGPHTMRRTFISIAREIGIPEIDVHALVNHSFSARNVQETYVRQSIEHLRDCQERIAATLTARFSGKPTSKPTRRAARRQLAIVR